MTEDEGGSWAVRDGQEWTLYDSWDEANEATMTGEFSDDAEVVWLSNPAVTDE